MRKVTQFKPQIASQSQNRAAIALLLSWVMIIGYLWIRFGRPMYGVAGVVALIHDVLIALAFVGISGAIGGANHPIGNFFLINDFRIDMTIVAAFLTIIGYSINDTIVVFRPDSRNARPARHGDAGDRQQQYQPVSVANDHDQRDDVDRAADDVPVRRDEHSRFQLLHDHRRADGNVLVDRDRVAAVAVAV